MINTIISVLNEEIFGFEDLLDKSNASRKKDEKLSLTAIFTQDMTDLFKPYTTGENEKNTHSAIGCKMSKDMKKFTEFREKFPSNVSKK